MPGRRAGDDGPRPSTRRRGSSRRPRNDLRQYEDLADEWWRPGGAFAALHWLARARADLIPPPPRPGAVLIDVGCGGGLMAGYVRGYRHVGVDASWSAARRAADHGVLVAQGLAERLPLPDRCADVVVAGELFEHVADLGPVIEEIARILRPSGLVVFDTVNDTRWARLSLVVVGERIPGGPPPRIHDPSLFVRPARVATLFGRHGISVRVRGLRPSPRDYLGFLLDRRRPVRMLPTRSLSSVYQGTGRKGT